MNLDPGGSLTRPRYCAVFVLVCLFLCLPVLTVSYVPLVDYPSHLARTYILAYYRSVPTYQRNYIHTHEILPNLAIDLIVPVLLTFLELKTASMVFLLCIVLLFAFGCHLLGQTVCGYSTKRAILCAFLVYNSMLFYGFVNYVFGLGMFCLVLALWLRWRNHWTGVRYALIALFVSFTYLVHLTAYAFLAIAFCVIEYFDCRRGHKWQDVLPSFALLIPEVVVFLVFRHPHAGGASWGTLMQKLIGLLPLLLTYNYRFDVCVLLVLLGLVLYGIMRVQELTIDRPVFQTGIAFLMLYVVTPHFWLGGSPVDARFIPPAVLLIIFSLQVQLPRSSARFLFVSVLLIFCIRLFMVGRTWHMLSNRITGQVELFQALPEGAALYPLFLPTHANGDEAKAERAFEHVAEYAVIVRHAFVPSQLAIPGQETVLFRAPLPYKDTSSEPKVWISSMRRYDFVWSHGTSAGVERALEENCDRILERDGFSIWRVRK
jgi:hypothetical protein